MKILKSNEIDGAILAIKNNDLVIFPTETVYGLGANALSEEAVDKIFKAKGRPSNNPLIVHLSKKEDILKYAIISNSLEQKLIDSFMPGPFTLILKKKDIIPSNVTCGLDTVGIRIPESKIARSFIEKCDLPIAAPSANLSSRPSGTNVSDIFLEFNDSVPYIIDDGNTKVGLESTVVKVINDIPTILRPGYITKEDIEFVCGKCNVIKEVLEKVSNNHVESPGLLYKHYAPNCKCLLVYSDNIDNLIDLINKNKTSKTLLIGSDKLKNLDCFKYINYGNSYEEIARNIFHLLREADTYNPDLIIIEGVKKEGLGLAIMNRLLRTCSFNYQEK